MAFHQEKDEALKNKFRTEPELCHIKKPHMFSDHTCELITKNDKICVLRIYNKIVPNGIT